VLFRSRRSTWGCPDGYLQFNSSCTGKDLLHTPFPTLEIFEARTDYKNNLNFLVQPQKIVDNIGINLGILFEINTTLEGKKQTSRKPDQIFCELEDEECNSVFFFFYLILRYQNNLKNKK
jgi:hypothetical protein